MQPSMMIDSPILRVSASIEVLPCTDGEKRVKTLVNTWHFLRRNANIPIGVKPGKIAKRQRKAGKLLCSIRKTT
jgi:hypothetical protein